MEKERFFVLVGDKTFPVVLRAQAEFKCYTPCPFCGKRHIHGQTDGHRFAHCQNGKNKKIEIAKGLFAEQKDGYFVLTTKGE